MSVNTDFTNITDGVCQVIESWEQRLALLSENTISNKRNKQNRTIKQLLGHLVDSASNNHQRMVRLQYNENLVFPDYTQDNDLWIVLQDYQHTDWNNLIMLWKSFNLHIVHIINSVDKSKLNNCWHDFEGNKVTLNDMINGYLGHLHLHMGEIEELIEQ